jgi:hypothetical protein
MSVAKVIEVISEGESIEKAIDFAVVEASDSLRQVKHVYVEGIQALVEDGKVSKYRVNIKLTFVVE